MADSLGETSDDAVPLAAGVMRRVISPPVRVGASDGERLFDLKIGGAFRFPCVNLTLICEISIVIKINFCG